MPRNTNPKAGNQSGCPVKRFKPKYMINGITQLINPTGKTKAQIQKRSLMKLNLYGLEKFSGFLIFISFHKNSTFYPGYFDKL